MTDASRTINSSVVLPNQFERFKIYHECHKSLEMRFQRTARHSIRLIIKRNITEKSGNNLAVLAK